MTDNGAIIRLEQVRKVLDEQLVLDGVDLEVESGRTTVVIGPSGCGKSVLLKHIVALLRPDSGRVFFDGNEISSMSERKLIPIRRRIGFLFQGGALFDSMTVEQNISFPMAEHAVGTRKERKRRCVEVLSLVGLVGLESKMPHELSGGEKKRVALARAIVLRPDVILYDEPTTGLDPIRADLINELIVKLQRVLGTTAIVVTHDLSSARKVGDRILMLHGGKFISDTPPEALEDVDDNTVRRFIRGQADEDNLEQLAMSDFTNGEFAPPGE